MSKIAERKALGAYPFEPIECCGGIADSNSEYRGLYQEGYDQAMQDFLEKACDWLSKNARNYYSAYTTSNKLIEDFKQYIEEEQ